VISIITPLYAQELPANITNMLTAQQLEDLKKVADQKAGTKDNNLPVAKMPEVQNTKDLKTTNKEELKVEDDEIPMLEEEKKPFINHYYEMLTQEQLTIFGKEAFKFTENNDLLFFNTPGDDYQLAAGDIVQVITRGLSVINEEAQIDNLGRLTLPIIAPFFAQGKTLEAIKEHILRELKTEDASASAYVTLSAARLIQVKVTGEVNNPQTIAVPAYTPLSQVLSRVGGISSLGSLRDIILTDTNQDKLRVDLYNILREANNFKEPLITASSRIHVNDIGLTVAVSGFVGRPRIFELKPGSKRISIKELLQLANANLIPLGTNFEMLNFNNEGVVNSLSFKSSENLYVNAGEALRLSFSETRNLKEAFVNGEVLNPFKIAVNPNGTSLKSILKGGAVLKQKALKRIAFVTGYYKDETNVTALNLKQILYGSDDFLIFPGDVIDILNEEEYTLLLEDDSDILYQNISEIFLDEERLAFIPNNQHNDLKAIILSQIILSQKINKDFAILSHKTRSSTDSVEAFNLGQLLNSKTEISINNNSRVNLFTNKYLTDILANINDVIVENLNLRSIKEVNPVEIFMDGNRIGILPPNSILNQTNLGKSLKINKNLYPLFVRETDNTTENNAGTTYKNINLSDLFKTKNKKLLAGQRIDVFSKTYISNLFTKAEEKGTDIVEILSSSSEEIDLGFAKDNLEQNKGVNPTTKVSEKTRYTLSALKRASKRISGAVENPGLYPVAGELTLKTLIDVAGGILPGGNKTEVTLRRYTTSDKGIIDISETLKIDVTSVDPKEIILSGDYDVLVPNFVNNAAVGVVTLSGEVMRPGEYTISRDETLGELMIRAGGLTSVAYPLGLILNRVSLKEREKEVNLALAQKLEQSILGSPKDSATDVAEQMKATLFYATRLRSLPVNGRLTVNYTGSSNSNGTMLEKDDEIIIPKRPSHVGVTGNVQNPLMASYEKNRQIDDYINDAGGFDRTADIKNIYVVLPNGKGFQSDQLKNYGGIIPPGATIVVPPKTDKLSVLGLTEVISRVLGNIATSLLAINAVSK